MSEYIKPEVEVISFATENITAEMGQEPGSKLEDL